jgi:hypothetical protein
MLPGNKVPAYLPSNPEGPNRSKTRISTRINRAWHPRTSPQSKIPGKDRIRARARINQEQDRVWLEIKPTEQQPKQQRARHKISKLPSEAQPAMHPAKPTTGLSINLPPDP